MLGGGAGRIYQSQRQHATLLELYKRGLESDAVSIGILVNERSFLDKQYMQESLPQSLDGGAFPLWIDHYIHYMAGDPDLLCFDVTSFYRLDIYITCSVGSQGTL